MAGTAAERLGGLSAHVQRARQRVAELQQRAAERRSWVAGHYQAADTEQGDLAHAELVSAERELAAEEQRLAVLVEAELAVSAAAQRDQWAGEAVAAEAQLAGALAERDRHLSAILPGLAAVKAAIRSARAAEQAARELDLRARGLRDAAAGRPAQVHRSNHGEVEALVGRSALLVQIERSAEV